MVESKPKNLGTAVDLNSNHNALKNSLNAIVHPDLLGEDSWIVVKKQKVNVLIPRLPTSEQSLVPDLNQGQLPGNICSNMTDLPSELPQEKLPKALLAERIDGSQSSPKVYSPADNAVVTTKLRKADLRRQTSKDQIGALRAFSGKTKRLPKSHKTSPKLVRPCMQPGLCGVMSISSINFNRKMRALNLERNILSAGGLGSWLSSLGLEQFEGIFRARNINKFHLADLSMKKLKDMGAYAVGPRRKLIHAIGSGCQPC